MSYTVTVSRDDRFWIAEVEGVPGGATETRALGDLDGEVRDLLSGLLDVDEDSLDLRYDFTAALGEETARAWERFEAERVELSRRQQQVESDRLAVLKGLRGQGVSLRDAAAVVGVSHQRVAQLLDA